MSVLSILTQRSAKHNDVPPALMLHGSYGTLYRVTRLIAQNDSTRRATIILKDTVLNVERELSVDYEVLFWHS